MYRNSFTGGRGRSRRHSSGRRPVRFFADIRKWLYRNSRLAIIIGGGVLLLAAIILVVFLVIVPAAKDKAPDTDSTIETDGLRGEDLEEAEELAEQLESGGIDDETLAGLTGEGLDEGDDITVTEEMPCTVGVICAAGSEAIAEGFGRHAETLIDGGSGMEAYLIYELDKESTHNSKVHDVKSLINKGCSVIVAADVDVQTYDMIVSLAAKNDIDVVAVNAPRESGYAVNVIGGSGDSLDELAAFMAANASGGSVEIIASSEEFGNAVADAAKAKGLNAAEPIKWNAEGSAAAFAERLVTRPEVIAAEGDVAVKVLEEGAKNGYIGEVFATEATAGIIKKWHDMKNDGLSVTVSEKQEDGSEITNILVSGFTSSCKLAAVAGSDKVVLGSAACEFAAKLAAEETLKEEGIVYEVPAPKPITDAEVETYYAEYKDAADSTPISAKAENVDVSAYFNAPRNTQY